MCVVFPPHVDTSFAERVHFTTAQHAIALGIDIPFVLCGVLCLWRIPALLYHLCTECENKEWPRRQAAARYLGCVDRAVCMA